MLKIIPNSLQNFKQCTDILQNNWRNQHVADCCFQILFVLPVSENQMYLFQTSIVTNNKVTSESILNI